MKTAVKPRKHNPLPKLKAEKSRVRIGIIGCGGIMRFRHIPDIMNNSRAELVAVSDTDPTQTRKLLDLIGSLLPAYVDYKTMIKKERLDAVFICTPHSMHYGQIRFALGHGLDMCWPKSQLTIRSSHAVALIKLAERKGLFLVVGYQRFFQEKSIYARHLIASGRIGEIRGVACYITQDWGDVSGWRANPLLSGGGFFMDTGSHLVSSMLRITGLKPVEVSAIFENYDKQVDICGIVGMRFDNGAMGSLNFFGSAGQHEERLTIHGSKGIIDLHSSHSGPHPMLLNNEPIEVPVRFRPSSPSSALIDWILSDGKGFEPQQTAVDTIKLSEAAYESAKQKKTRASALLECIEGGESRRKGFASPVSLKRGAISSIEYGRHSE